MSDAKETWPDGAHTETRWVADGVASETYPDSLGGYHWRVFSTKICQSRRDAQLAAEALLAGDLGKLLESHGRWDLRSPDGDGMWHAHPAYQSDVMGVGRTVMLAVQDALAQMTGYPEGIMTRKVKGKCRGCGRGMKVMIAECELGFFFRKCKYCQNGNYIDVTDGVVTFK